MRSWYALVWREWIGIFVFIVLITSPNLRAYAADREELADVRCVVVAMHMATLSNPQQRSAGVMIATYYLGRLDGRASQMDVELLIEEEANKMTPADLRSDAVRCGSALKKKG